MPLYTLRPKYKEGLTRHSSSPSESQTLLSYQDTHFTSETRQCPLRKGIQLNFDLPNRSPMAS